MILGIWRSKSSLRASGCSAISWRRIIPYSAERTSKTSLRSLGVGTGTIAPRRAWNTTSRSRSRMRSASRTGARLTRSAALMSCFEQTLPGLHVVQDNQAGELRGNLLRERRSDLGLALATQHSLFDRDRPRVARHEQVDRSGRSWVL